MVYFYHLILNKMMTLPEFFDKYGSDTTSNFDLLDWSKQLGIPKVKVIMKK